jgi:hypothetical protein
VAGPAVPHRPMMARMAGNAASFRLAGQAW